jgi:hypothetical protein
MSSDEEKMVTDDKLIEQEKFLMSLPEDVRKFYVKKKGVYKRGTAEFAIPPIDQDVEVVFVYDVECPHCREFMLSVCYQAITRYLWARGVTFRVLTKDEAFEALIGTVVWPDHGLVMPVPGSSVWAPFGTPMLVVVKNKGKPNEEIHHIVVETKALQDKPLHYFYWVQMRIEGQVTVPSLSMALALRKLQSEHRKKRRGKLSIEPEDLDVPEPPKQSTQAASEASPSSLSPCEAQPRC